LIATRSVNDVRPETDAGDTVVKPIDASVSLVGLLVYAIMGARVEGSFMGEHPR